MNDRVGRDDVSLTVVLVPTFGAYAECLLNWPSLQREWGQSFCPIVSSLTVPDLTPQFPYATVRELNVDMSAASWRRMPFDPARYTGELTEHVLQAYRVAVGNAEGFIGYGKGSAGYGAEVLASEQPPPVVVAFRNDWSFLPAAVHAILCGGTFTVLQAPEDCEDLLEIDDRQSVVIFCDASSLGNRWFSALPRPHGPRVGLLPVSSPSGASLLVARLAEARAARTKPIVKSLYVDMFDSPVSADYPRVRILASDEAESQAIRRAMREEGVKPDLFMISTHGAEDHLYILHDIAVFSSSNEQVRPWEIERVQPILDEIPASIWMVNTCLGGQLGNGLTDPNSRLGVAALEHAAHTFVSTNQAKGPSTGECCLFFNLVSAGYTLGECVRDLNTWLELHGLDQRCYVLFGDPTLSRGPMEGAFPEYAMGSSGGRMRISPRGSSLATVRLKGIPTTNLPSLYVTAMPIPAQTYFGFFPTGEATCILRIFNWKGLGLDELSVTLAPRPPYLESLEHWYHSYPREVQQLEECQISSRTLKHSLNALSEELASLARLAVRARFELGVEPDLRRRNDVMTTRVRTIQRELLDSLIRQSRSRPWMLRYRRSFVVEPGESLGPQCACGHILRKMILSHVFTSQHRRCRMLCPNCGLVSDCPGQAPIVRITGPIRASAGEEVRLSLEFQSGSAVPELLSWAICVEGERNMLVTWELEPSHGERVLNGHLEEKVIARIPRDAAHIKYRIAGYAISNLDISFFRHSVIVTGP